MSTCSQRRPSRGERGSVLVLLAFVLPVVILIAAFVIDLGNAWVHRRHLQMQVDAAAFAGGDAFQSCFGGSGNQGVFDAATPYNGATAAQDYFPGYTGPARLPTNNSQIGGGADRVHLRYNNGYWYKALDGTPPTLVDGTQDPDYTPGSNGTPLPQSSVDGGPCASPYVFDVKASEVDVPLFFGGFWGLIRNFSAINTQARMQLHAISGGKPTIPLAPSDASFTTTTVTFTNASGNELTGCGGSGLVAGTGCTFRLGSAGCIVSASLDVSCGSVTVPVAAGSKVLMRVGLNNSASSCAGTTLHCFDTSDSSTGLYAIRGTPASGPAFELTPWTTCAANGSPFYSPINTACRGGVSLWLADSIASTANVTATLGDGLAANKNVALTRCTDGTNPLCHDTTRNAWLWSTTVNAFTLNTGLGLDTITITNGHTTLATHQFYSGGNAGFSGPVQLVQVTEGGVEVGSVSAGSHTFTVNVGYSTYTVNTPCSGTSGAGYSCGSDPTVLLRSKLPNSSATMAFDCGAGGNLRDQIIGPCTNLYQLHPGPPYTPTCDNVNPPDCATVGPVGAGTSAGQVRQGMNTRWGSSCNNYPNYAADPTNPDPRLIIVILTDANAWDGGTGSNVTVPITRFAAFYVTGWDGAAGGCTNTNEPYPEPGSSQIADIWGHFVKYVDAFDGTPSDEICAADSATPCVPVLSK